MVLEDGSILEFDAPNKLLEFGSLISNRETLLSLLYSMYLCDQWKGTP